MAQDDYYYEIQLTNKQLVFYFLAGATGLILSFLAGVMVGRGVDSGTDGGHPRVAQEDRRPGDEPRPTPSPTAAGYDYSRRLEGERRDDGLDRPAPTPSPTPVTLEPVASPTPVAVVPTPSPEPSPVPSPVRVAQAPSPKPTPRVRPTPRPRDAGSRNGATTAPSDGVGGFTIQVGAFKERKAAESTAARLKARGFPAYVVSPAGAPNGLFNVRVGSYPARTDAERVQARLRDHEKFRPFIVKN